MTLLIYYNPNHQNFYIVYTNYLFSNYFVGFENGYGHVIVQILVYRHNKLINVNSYSDISRSSHKESLKSRLARRMIRWLNKYRE